MWYKKAFKKESLSLITLNSLLRQILHDLRTQGYLGLLVGGSVRDAIMGQLHGKKITPKDIDIEVYGISISDLEKFLSQYGQVDTVGKSFGVIKLRDSEGLDYDFSVPRTDNKMGTGHKDFQVTMGFNEDGTPITPKQAALRRDFTINSLAYDPFGNKVHDYFNGVNDLKNGLLRHTGEAFKEDPLRVLRGMQFVSRLYSKKCKNCNHTMEDDVCPSCGSNDYVEVPLKLSPETIKECEKIIDEYSTLPKERVVEEWMKLVQKGAYPGEALAYLQQTGWIKHYPELDAMIGVPQEPEWHPEGPLEDHVKHTMNSAAQIAKRDQLNPEETAALVLAALVHDLGKPSTTEQTEKNGEIRWTSHGHAEAGEDYARNFLKSIGVTKSMINQVVPLVVNHMKHLGLKNVKNPDAWIREFSTHVHPSTIHQLVRLIEADHSGRPPYPPEVPQQALEMLNLAQKHDVAHGRLKPVIFGQHVMPYFNNNPGPHIGEFINEAYEAQKNNEFSTLEEGLKWLRKRMQKVASLIKGKDVLPLYNNVGGKHIQDMLNRAWEAQMNGEFNSREEALTWLRNQNVV